MNSAIENFINGLEELKASNSELPNFVLEMFTIEEKKHSKEHLIFNKELMLLEELILNYSMNNISFADYGLNSQLEEINEDLIGFATSSHSVLGFSSKKNDQEIYEYDRENLTPLYPVALNQEAFLNAILVLMEMYSKKYSEPSIEKKKEFEKVFFPLVVEKAGGDKYSNFFKHVIFW